MNTVNEPNEYEFEEEHSSSAFGNLFETVVDMFKLMKRYMAVCIAVIAVFSAAAFAYSRHSYEALYKTTATFSITPLVAGNSTNGVSVYQFNYTSSFADQLAQTFPYVAQSNNLRDVIKSDLGGYINGTITATAVTSTNVFQVTVTSASADDTVKIMDSFIKCFPKISDYIIGDTRLNMIYRSGKPTEPINTPDHFRHTSYGFAFGLLIDIVVFFFMALNKETIKTKTDINIKLNGKCLGEIPTVPERSGGKSKGELLRAGAKRPMFSESVRFLKKRVVSAFDKGDKIIGITSAVSGDGKTTVAFNLALTVAGSEENVLLVDLNVTKPSLQKLLLKNPEIKNGISDFCAGDVEINDMIYNYKNNFDIIFGGSPMSKPDGERISQLLTKIKQNYDYVIIDMPDCSSGADVSMISDMCDDLAFVLRCDSTSVSDIKSSFRHVLYSKARFIGFILNEAKYTGSSYYNRYGNGYRYGSYGRYSSYGKLKY